MMPIRLAVVCDYLEERWPSMDLVGDMILDGLAGRHSGEVAATRVRPAFRRRFARLPALGGGGAARNADRLMNRFGDYPRALRHLAGRGGFDLFHVVDHSYSQLVHVLPADRTVVTCHDLDTFRCLLEPGVEPRPRWFRAMARRILDGLQKAAVVACDSEATRLALLRYGLVPEERLRLVHLGIHPGCSAEADPAADAEAERLLGPVDPGGPPDLLHVGSNIPRKRIDVLLGVFAAVRRERPGTRLVKVGGPFTPEQDRRAEDLGVSDAIVRLPFLDRPVLSAVYRRAALVLQPSEAEGFGFPVAEAMACGAAVLASDLPVLREVGGEAAVYRPVGDIPSWTGAALDLLEARRSDPDAWRARREAGLARSSLFSWDAHVDRLVEIYRALIGGRSPVAARPAAAAPTP
jgi:glycosyltransferase involved in cell wall biosynthesis